MSDNDIKAALLTGSLKRAATSFDTDNPASKCLSKQQKTYTRRKIFAATLSALGAGAAVVDTISGVKALNNFYFTNYIIRDDFLLQMEPVRAKHFEVPDGLQKTLEGRFGQLYPNEIRLIRAINKLNDKKSYLSDEDFRNLSGAMHVSSPLVSRSIALILSPHCVRIGATETAKDIMSSANKNEINDARSRMSWAQETMSINYVGLDRSSALIGNSFNFGESLRLIQDEISQIGVSLRNDDSVDISVPGASAIRDLLADFSVRGAYVLIFSLLYWVVQDANRSDAVDKLISDKSVIVEKILLEISNQASRLGLRFINSALWNSAFIFALQYHRMGRAGLRDKFMKHCLDENEFRGGGGPPKRWEQLAGTDPMAVLSAHFLRSTPGLVVGLGAASIVPSVQRLRRALDDMAPSSAAQSADVLRKIMEPNREIASDLAIMRHGYHEGGLAIYHEKSSDVRQGLLTGNG